MADVVVALPASVRRYQVTRAILAASAEVLRRGSAGVREAVILWQGRVVDKATVEITRIVVPRQITGPLHFNVPLDERLRIADAASQQQELILVQLHTHPQEAFHSEADDRYAIIKHTGALSIVIPEFAVGWQGDLLQTAVFVHRGGAVWDEVSKVEVTRLFEVIT